MNGTYPEGFSKRDKEWHDKTHKRHGSPTSGTQRLSSGRILDSENVHSAYHDHYTKSDHKEAANIHKKSLKEVESRKQPHFKKDRADLKNYASGIKWSQKHHEISAKTAPEESNHPVPEPTGTEQLLSKLNDHINKK